MSETKSPKKAASSTKQNLFQKAKSFLKGYRAPKGLKIFSIGVLTLTLTLSALALWSANQSKDVAKAASTTFSNGNVTIDKKYVTAGVESDTASVVQGGTTTVRLRYTNSGDTSITDAKIKDTIPANFNYVPGTFKNCLNPTATELACDTLTPANKDVAFSSLTTPANGLSPAAGLYDAASVANTAGGTAPASTSGLLGIGKKRYLTYESLDFDPNTGQPGNCGLYAGGLSQNSVGGFNPFGNSILNALSGSSCGVRFSWDSLGRRYLTYESLDFDPYSSQPGDCGVYAGGLTQNNVGGFNPFGNTILNAQVGGCGARFSFDSLGKRYLTYESLAFDPNSAQPGDCGVYAGGLTQNNVGGFNPFGNTILNATGGSSCGVRKSWDTLDTTRSSGYIEYQLQSANTTPVGTYGTNVTLNGTGITGGLSDGLFSTVAPQAGITITSTPAPSISSTKLYSTDGINWSPTVTALTGQQVFVRLLRDNNGTASASDVNQKDTIPTPFTYVAGSFKNCLSPSITNISDATPNVTELACDTLAANKDTALTKLASNTGVSPVAGLYDAADTTANGTAISSATGLMEIGKKRYLSQKSASTTINGSLGSLGTIYDPSCFGAPSLSSASNSPTVQTYTYACSYEVKTDLLGYRYLSQKSASTTINGSLGSLGTIYDPSCFGAPSLSSASNSSTVQTYTYACSYEVKTDLLDSTRAQAFIEYKITTPTNATAGNYGTVSTLASTNASNTFSQTSGVAGSGINLVYPDLTTAELGALVVTCNGGSSVTLGVPTTCTFPLTNKSLPLGFKLGIGDSTPFGNCALNAAVVTCTGVPTGSVAGPNKPIRAQIGSEAIKTTTGTVTVVAASTDTLFIDPSKITFSPIESAAVKFGSADLTLTVGGSGKDDPRFTANSTTAVCKFKLKEFGALDADATKGFDASLTKLAGSVADLDLTNKTFDVAYSQTTGCSVKLPLGTAQNQPKWFFEVRVVRSDTQVFGQNMSYFMTYGAIGGVSVSG